MSFSIGLITTASFGDQEYRRNIAANSAKFRDRYHGLFPNLPEDPAVADWRWLPRRELGLTPELDLAMVPGRDDGTVNSGAAAAPRPQ